MSIHNMDSKKLLCAVGHQAPFAALVEAIKLIETSSNRLPELLGKFNKKIPVEFNSNGMKSKEPEPAAEVVATVSEVNVNILFNAAVEEDMVTTVVTLEKLGLLEESLRSKLNDKIIEKLFETDFVGEILKQQK